MTVRYLLRPSLEVFPTSDGDVYLLRPGGATQFAVRQPDPDDRSLLADLAAGPLLVRPGSSVAERLRPLVEAGAVIIEDDWAPLGGNDAVRFARQLPYFAERGQPAAAQRRLREATIVMLGCGGLGSWALGALACAGVGRFVLVDDDVVESSNLNRQVLYREADIGRLKVERAADWLHAFDPAIDAVLVRHRVGSAADLAPLLTDADALVQAADEPPYELARWVNAACLDSGTPWITAGQQPPLLKIGPVVVPRRSSCFACHETAVRREFPLYDELTEHRMRNPTPATTLGPASGVVGAILALELMHVLTEDRPVATEGRVLLLDMRTLAARWETIERDPDCIACGPWVRDPGPE